jgi:hypothetical protein
MLLLLVDVYVLQVWARVNAAACAAVCSCFACLEMIGVRCMLYCVYCSTCVQL